MNRIITAVTVLILLCAPTAWALSLDDIGSGLKKGLAKNSKGLSDKKAADGLREALSVGTKKAVKKVSKRNGYYSSPKIHIPLPKKMKKVAKVLGKVGMKKDMDKFVLSMNRAAEHAAPVALDLFIEAIKNMTIKDAVKIIKGDDTAATEYFRSSTSHRLYILFKPEVSASMNKVGVTRQYKRLMKKYSDVPFVDSVSVDLDDYVTNMALSGLFYMVGQQEKKIRKEPAARVTKLLREVFGD